MQPSLTQPSYSSHHCDTVRYDIANGTSEILQELSTLDKH